MWTAFSPAATSSSTCCAPTNSVPSGPPRNFTTTGPAGTVIVEGVDAMTPLIEIATPLIVSCAPVRTAVTVTVPVSTPGVVLVGGVVVVGGVVLADVLPGGGVSEVGGVDGTDVSSSAGVDGAGVVGSEGCAGWTVVVACPGGAVVSGGSSAAAGAEPRNRVATPAHVKTDNRIRRIAGIRRVSRMRGTDLRGVDLRDMRCVDIGNALVLPDP